MSFTPKLSQNANYVYKILNKLALNLVYIPNPNYFVFSILSYTFGLYSNQKLYKNIYLRFGYLSGVKSSRYIV